MTKNTTFKLDLSHLDNLLSSYAEKEGLVINPIDSQKQIRLAINTKEDTKTYGYLTIFLKKDGCSFLTQGKLSDLCNNLKKEIVCQTLMPEDGKNVSATFTNVSSDIFDLIQPSLLGIPNVTIKDWDASGDTHIQKRFYVESPLNRVAVTYFNTNTLLIQGLSSPVMSDVLETCVDQIPNTKVDEYGAPIAEFLIDPNLSTHITDLARISGTIIEKWINSAIKLINYIKEIDDYSCLCFPIMRALDGIMSKRILEVIPGGFETYGTIFDYDKTTHVATVKHGEIKHQCNANTISALERCYEYVKTHRHPISHVETSDIEASTIISTREEAAQWISDALSLINNMCNNW